MMEVKKFLGGQKIFRGLTNYYGHKKKVVKKILPIHSKRR